MQQLRFVVSPMAAGVLLLSFLACTDPSPANSDAGPITAPKGDAVHDPTFHTDPPDASVVDAQVPGSPDAQVPGSPDAQVPGSPDAQAPDRSAVTLLGFGDSVTDGFCASSGRSYFELLEENDDFRYPANRGRDLQSHFGYVSVTNFAVSGATSCDFSVTQLRQALRSVDFNGGPTVVTITIGGNDLIHDYGCGNPQECAAFCSSSSEAEPWAVNFKARLEEFMEVFREEVPGSLHIFLANIYDPTDGVGDIENAPVPLPPWRDGLQILARFNRVLTEIAAQSPEVHLVDMRGAMLGHGIHYDEPANPHYDSQDPSYWYCSNLEDPNDRGYHAIRNAFYEEIARVLAL